jgi:hypothetical protein
MRLKHSVLALAAAGLLAVQAHAGEAATLAPVAAAPEAAKAAFSAADIESLFIMSDAPVQVAALSAKEMSETEGAWLNFAIGGLAGGAIQGGGFILGVHRGHHQWDTGRFIGNVGTGAAFGATTGQLRFLASGVSGIRNLATPGGAVWAFNNTVGNWGFNHVWRRP